LNAKLKAIKQFRLPKGRRNVLRWYNQPQKSQTKLLLVLLFMQQFGSKQSAKC